MDEIHEVTGMKLAELRIKNRKQSDNEKLSDRLSKKNKVALSTMEIPIITQGNRWQQFGMCCQNGKV